MPGRVHIHIQKTSEESAQFAAGLIVRLLTSAINERATGSLVLSGGETPRRVYQILASQPLSSRLDWKNVQLFFGDERMVPPDHPDSNFGMARHELINRVPVPQEDVHRMKGELPPELAAEDYTNQLRASFKSGIPRFDCVLLGIGEDGHTASLFPGTEALKEAERTVAAVFVPRLNAWRTTLTFPVLNNARDILFLAEGSKKSPVVRRIVETLKPSPEIPATMVRPHDGVLHWVLDSEAAASLRR